MAGPFSPTARGKSTRNDYGTGHGSHAPSSFWALILDGDPEFDGAELDPSDCPGYERQPVAHTDFVEVDQGVQVTISGFEATGPWTTNGKVVLLISADDETEWWDYSFIETLKVTEAGPLSSLVFTVYYSDDSTTPG